jgi:hypothetical protein
MVYKNVWIDYVYTIFTFLPIIVYFSIVTFEEPHDCFSCFSRIDQSTYSLFEYTAFERNVIYEQQRGQGAVRYH